MLTNTLKLLVWSTLFLFWRAPTDCHAFVPSSSSFQPPHTLLLPTTHSSNTALFGIPKMFRWLTDQYPNINKRLQEGLGEIPEVHNFYLDMNGIIHPCTHGNAEGEIIVLDETAMFKKIFLYVDRYVVHSVSQLYMCCMHATEETMSTVVLYMLISHLHACITG